MVVPMDARCTRLVTSTSGISGASCLPTPQWMLSQFHITRAVVCTSSGLSLLKHLFTAMDRYTCRVE